MSSGINSSIPVQVTAGSIPANYTPPNDMQGVLEAVAQYTSYSTPVSGPAIVISSTGVETEPDTGQQVGADPNGIWIWVRGPGFTLAPKPMAVYRNSWWQVYSGMPGEIRMFVGDPRAYFDGSGRGLEAAGWEGWCLCNGQNGTPTLTDLFIVPGYRSQAGLGWITNVGSILDQPGWAYRPAGGATFPYGVGGGGYGPGWNPGWLSPMASGPGALNYRALATPVSAIVAPIDSQQGGYPWFQFGLWNFGSIDPPSSGPTVAGWPSLNINLVDQTKMKSVQFGQDPTKHYGGGVTGIYWPGVPDPMYGVGTWTFPIDQTPRMHNTTMSRLPPYIAAGFAIFVGYL